MARTPAWDDEVELKAFGGNLRPSGGSRWKNVLLGLCAVGAATFVLGYYLPLYQAHAKLTSDHRSLRQKSQAAGQSLQKAQTELSAASVARDKLQGEQTQREQSQKAAVAKLSAIQSELGPKLEKLAKKGALLELSGTRLAVGLSEGLLFVPQKAELSPRGKSVLCEVAKASGAAPLRVSAVIGSSGDVAPMVPAEFKSAWAFSSARAASVADALETKCGVPAAKLSAVGHGVNQPSAGSELAKQLPTRVEIEIVGGDSKQ